jgi:hypothetical protein
MFASKGTVNNASAVKNYNAKGSLTFLKTEILSSTFKNALAYIHTTTPALQL